MDFLTASILSGLIYDGVKDGFKIGFDLLKAKLKGWIVDDEQIEEIIQKLKEAGINEDLAPHAIERKISEEESLMDLIHKIRASEETKSVNQFSNIGNNINSTGTGNISVGSIIINRGDE